MWRRFVRCASLFARHARSRRRCGNRRKCLYDDGAAAQSGSPKSHRTMREYATAPASHTPEAKADRAGLLSMLVHLWPYIWPADRRDLKARVLFATVLIFVAKLATVAVPFTFKWATDALAGHGTAPVWANHWLAWALATPVMMTLAYGGMRIIVAVLTQWRDGVFAKVAMNAVRRLALLTFEHMHLLSLRFHLERKTGGLTRVLERGRNAIETIVRMLLLQLLPTIVEVALVTWVLFFHFDWRYVIVVLLTVALYVGFTFYATEWRIGIRRTMNDSDTDANAKAIDSLLNYETVKYFSAEQREAERYDRSMARASRPTRRSPCSMPGRQSCSRWGSLSPWCFARTASRPEGIRSAISS